MGLLDGFKKRGNELRDTALGGRRLGVEDAEAALSVLEAVGGAMSSGDEEIRTALAALSREAGRAGIGFAGEAPWPWLAEVGRVGSAELRTERVCLHAVAMCRWWLDISPQLTPLDFRETGCAPLQPDAAAQILEAALPVIVRRPGSEMDVYAGTGLLVLGHLKCLALELLADLSARGVPLSEGAQAWASRPRVGVDASLLDGLGEYGRGEFAALAAGITAAPEVEMAVAHRVVHLGEGFVHDLAASATDAGGWVAVGAERAIATVTGSNLDNPVEKALLNVAVGHLRARRIPPVMVTGLEWECWLAMRADLEAQNAPAFWAVRAPEPDRGSHQLRALAPGEERHVATIDHRPESNRYFVRREGSEYVWEVDAPWSSENPTRGRSEQSRKDDLWDLYAEMGRSLGLPPAFVVDDFAPFDGIPRPDMAP